MKLFLKITNHMRYGTEKDGLENCTDQFHLRSASNSSKSMTTRWWRR